ncbi:LD-carboxypeptidase [uncultured Gemella sp.]|uniref:S66 family peptidase n=1 Tax=uncultured Gemella sp. TaxID=254352 RepID=UPI0028D412EA|nr:LD-carboxypeptidase [uncultured Gemella sp.]
MLEINNKVALVVCSNGKAREDKVKLDKLEEILKSLGLVPVYSNYLYKDKFGRSASAEIRSEELMNFFSDKSIKAIFDISGGDLSNEILDYLDYDIIKKNIKPFFGYSDLSVVLNAITIKTGESTYLYQVLNIIGNENIRDSFKKTVMYNEPDLTNISWNFFQGEEISGIVAGGNIRCFLKLAGTQYFPDLENRILFLEGLGTTVESLITHLIQLKQMGVFDKISGLLLGTFTNIEKIYNKNDIYSIVKDFIDKDLPVAKTSEVGHDINSKMITIGGRINIKKLSE